MKLRNLLNRPFDRVKITPLGRFFSVFTLLFGIATINSGNNLLYMILAYLLILLFASGILSTANILFLHVQATGQEAIYKKRTGNIILKVSKGKIPGFFLYFCTDTGCAFLPVLTSRVALIKVPYKGKKRGIQTISDITVYSLFPFGFAKRWRNIRIDAKVMVFPAIDREVDDAYIFKRYLQGEESSSKRGFDGEFRGLRRYKAGESLYHIHWKKSFKELNLKEFGTMEQDSLVFQLPQDPSEDDIDNVASTIHQWLKAGKSVGLFAEGRFFVPPSKGSTHEYNLMKRLALL